MPIITGGGAVTVTVQVCFNQDPNDPTPPAAVWTDITQRCSNVRITRGRQFELDKIEPGSFSAQVNNDDGALTPGNTSSAYWPGVMLYRQIQVIVNYQSTNHTLFTGFVTQWPQAYNSAGQRPSTTLAAVDALGLLALVKLKGWAVDAYTVLGASVLYPLNDAAGATQFGASIGAIQQAMSYFFPGAPAGAIAPGTSFDTTMPGFAGQTYTTFAPTTPAGSAGGAIIIPTGYLPASGAWTISFWFKQGSAAVGTQILLSMESSTPGQAQLGISCNTGTQQVNVFCNHLAGAGPFNTLLSPLTSDLQWHLVSVSLSADQKTLRAVVDTSAAVTLQTATSPVISLTSIITTALGSDFISLGGDALFSGGLANFAVFPADLCSDPTNPLQTILYPAGKTAFAGESTGARAKRIATAAGFGADFTAVP